MRCSKCGVDLRLKPFVFWNWMQMCIDCGYEFGAWWIRYRRTSEREIRA